MHKTIFITIPSYEDPDLIKTIDAAISNASYPKNLHFAVALQYKNTPKPSIDKYYKRPNTKFTSYDVDTRPGVCQVRHDLLKLYNGEDYLLMLDSHMTFIKNWDEIMIREYETIRQQESKSSVIISLTTGPDAEVTCSCFYTDEICSEAHKITKFKTDKMKNNFSSEYPLRHIQHIFVRDVELIATHTDKNYERIIPLSAGTFFSSGDWISEVGIVDGVHISGEEPFMSFRSYIAGWDAYTIKNIDIVGHDAKNYNITVWGAEIPNKMYTRVHDDHKTSLEINEAFLFNSGRFAITNPKRTPEDFWSEIGMAEEFSWAKQRWPFDN
jgi:hypothetical protein